MLQHNWHATNAVDVCHVILAARFGVGNVWNFCCNAVEVVEVDGPDGRATEAVVDNQVRLLRDGLDVVIADPLPSAGRGGAAAVGAGRLGQLVGGNCKKVKVVWDLGSNRRLG